MLAPTDPFPGIPRGHFGAILADPPWKFETWGSQENSATCVERHYNTMTIDEIAALPIGDLAAKSCVLFLWICWPTMHRAMEVIDAWGFTYKTCAFSWTKADVSTVSMFSYDHPTKMGTGYWTRANTEPCLLATRGEPKRVNADVRQAIIEPRREHSRKPDCVHERIERLVAGPYLELFARRKRPGWTAWGNETGKFNAGGIHHDERSQGGHVHQTSEAPP